MTRPTTARATHRLPDYLGGHEAELITSHGNGRVDVLTLHGVIVELEYDSLTAITQPDPPIGAMMLDRDGDVWWHHESGWSMSRAEAETRPLAEVDKRFGPLTPVIVDPAVNAPTELTITENGGGSVTFKYEGKLDGHHCISVHFLDRIFGYVPVDDHARALAGLILRAHQEARNA